MKKSAEVECGPPSSGGKMKKAAGARRATLERHAWRNRFSEIF